jgi:hypothetical protein
MGSTPAEMTDCSSEGAERVRAEAGALDTASIVAPTIAAIEPPERTRNSIDFLQVSRLPAHHGACHLNSA